MNIEQELLEWLGHNIPEQRKEKPRNIQIILSYYGFGDLPSPTLDELARNFSIGTRERVRQIINNTFRNRATLKQLPIANDILDAVAEYDLVSIPELRSILEFEGLLSPATSIRGVLNLGRDLGWQESYDIYDSSLTRVSRSEAEFDSNTFLVKGSALPDLKKGLRKARTLPGQLGLSRLDYLRSEFSNAKLAERIIIFVHESPDAVKVNAGNEHWYIYEDRDNTLINSCEKLFTLCDGINIDVLSHALENSLRRRSHRFAYPGSHIISDWIRASRWFTVNEKVVEFLGERNDLTDIEKAVVAYLSSVDYSLYPPLKEHLLEKGFSEPAINKAVTTSPLVYVDKTGQRKTYKYILTSKYGASADVLQSSDRYQEFRNRLKKIRAAGTDIPRQLRLRREQAALREWLFGECSESYCAICGERFSVTALVAAHKKKRSNCNESERVDPYIVFPLCVFGCDYLYESGALKVISGKVELRKVRASKTHDMVRARELQARTIPEEWTRGAADYFEGSMK